MLGGHCIKTWSATQQAYALSSAEAELYGMVEAVTRAKGLMSLCREMGFRDVSSVVKLGTDSSAAKLHKQFFPDKDLWPDPLFWS